MIGITAQQQTFFSMDLNPEKLTQWESRKVHPLIKRLFLSKSIADVPLAGRLKHLGAWMKIRQDPKILDIVKGYKNPFHSKSFQLKIPSQTRGRIDETGGKSNVEGGSHQESSNIKRDICKQLIPCKKKDESQKPVIHLKQLNAYIPYIATSKCKVCKI